MGRGGGVYLLDDEVVTSLQVCTRIVVTFHFVTCDIWQITLL